MAPMDDDFAARRAEEKRRRARRDKAFDIFLKVLVVVVFFGILALAIWLRSSVLPCDWMPLKDAPPRCLTGVSR